MVFLFSVVFSLCRDYPNLVKNRGYSYPDRISMSDEGATVAAFYSRRLPPFHGR